MNEDIWQGAYDGAWLRLETLRMDGHNRVCPDVMIIKAHISELHELGKELGYMRVDNES